MSEIRGQGSPSHYTQPVPVIKVITTTNSNITSTPNKKHNFSRSNYNPKTSSNLRNNRKTKSNVKPIDTLNYSSSTQKLQPTKTNWKKLSDSVHELNSKCFVNLTNQCLMAEFSTTQSILDDFLRLAKLIFNNARPTRANPRQRMNKTFSPKPPSASSQSSQNSARRSINKDISPPTDGAAQTINRNTGSDLRPTSVVCKLGLDFIDHWDSFLGEFNIIVNGGIRPLQNLIKSRLSSIYSYLHNTVSSFFASPQPNVSIGNMNRAFSTIDVISNKIKKLIRRPEDFPYGVPAIYHSLDDFFAYVVPRPMLLTCSIQDAQRNLTIALIELQQMVDGLAVFESIIQQIRTGMDEMNTTLNNLFLEMNLPYRIIASYEDEEDKNENKNEDEIEEEEEDCGDEVPVKSIPTGEISDININPRHLSLQRKKKKEQDPTTIAHLDKIRSNIAKIEEALVIGQSMMKKKKS